MSERPRIPMLLVLILLVSWGLMLINLDLPWWEQGGDNGAWIGTAVLNYHRFGADTLGFMQILNFEPATPENFVVYINHPPMIVWLTGLASGLFGFHEMSFRLTAAFMTLISTVGMYLLLRRLTHNPTQSLWGTALYAFTPMMLYYGRMPNHEAPALAFLLLLLAVLVNLSWKITRRDLMALIILTVLCAWTAWAVLIFIGFAALWLLWLNPRHNVRWFTLMGVTMLIAVFALLMYYVSQYPDTLTDLNEAFFFRTSNRELSRNSATFTLTEFVWQNFIHIISLFTPSLLILSVVGIAVSYRRADRRAGGMLLILFLSALTYFLVFRNATYIHNYYKIYLAPAFALSASYAMVMYQPYYGRKRRVLSAVMQGLILGGVITGGIFFALLHQSADRPQWDEMRDLLAEQTQAGDTVYTNLTYGVSPLSLYAETKIQVNVMPAQIIDLIDADRHFHYLYCDRGNGEEFTLPDNLSMYETIPTESCFYFRFE